MEEAHVRQVKFYLWLLELNGVDGVTGILKYPKLRKTDEVLFSNSARVSSWGRSIEIHLLVFLTSSFLYSIFYPILNLLAIALALFRQPAQIKDLLSRL